MNPVALDEYRKERLAESFDELAAHARAGEVTGWTGTVKFGGRDHRHYALGDYVHEANQAVAELQALQKTLTGLQSYTPPPEPEACMRCSLHHLAWINGTPLGATACPGMRQAGAAAPPPAHCPHREPPVANAITTNG